MEHSPAILLRKMPWSETSLILTWLTERFGTLKTVARGARKPGSPMAGRLDSFFSVEMTFSPSRRGDLHILREVAVQEVFDAARAGSAGFYSAAYFAGLAGATAPAMHPAPEIFDLLARALRYVQKEPATVRGLLYFERELSRILGVFDETGKVSPVQAIASLQADLFPSREAALHFLDPVGKAS